MARDRLLVAVEVAEVAVSVRLAAVLDRVTVVVRVAEREKLAERVGEVERVRSSVSVKVTVADHEGVDVGVPDVVDVGEVLHVEVWDPLRVNVRVSTRVGVRENDGDREPLRGEGDTVCVVVARGVMVGVPEGLQDGVLVLHVGPDTVAL